MKAAVHEALTSPLLGEINLKDAKGALIRVVGGPDMSVGEAQRAAEIVTNSVNERARIIWGCSVDPELEGTIKILLIVTGASSKYMYGKGGAPTSKLGALEDDVAKPKLGGQPQQYRQQPQQQRPAPVDDDGIDFVR